MRVLVIEDNPRLIERVTKQLQKWFMVEAVTTGHEALSKVAAHHFDLAILDLGLPDMPGLEVCQRLREFSAELLILIVTGVDETPSKVDLLNAGADDYLTKPFDALELRARINALARRRIRQPSSPLITVADLVIDPATRTVTRAGMQIELRRKEYDVLEYIVINKGRSLTREMIFSHAWSSDSRGWEGSIDVQIKNIRDKVDRPFSQQLIKTIYGVGYIVEDPALTKTAEDR